ncbi:hypothetical protein O1L55_40065 [Streptomyces albulus]|nr:hypothetical protein [Streptomyces noursei]
MRAGDGVEVRDVGEVDPGADDVADVAAGLLRAAATRCSTSAACRPASSPPIGPSGPEAVVPETETNGPTRTARE